ncbi:Ppx/GppA family phosphatase [Flexivirga sp. ID2601S]|uniref:Ppx/GppA family phosphatase n=1 Tax=Flexivirga aerilata TaxID=1656889 RepID=A0A849ADF4_9MICO|nr:Ppx/GppA phosphatase family protein [Flexivirga aerilata]NNG37937.1 Ppx/GppA family phosphatase [Flexivirga aerilata]
MRLGVIDVGSNTVHLLVVDAHRGAHPLPASSHKRELRLSEHTTADGSIAREGVERLIGFVGECLTIAEDQGIEDLLAFATSAIREAPNGEAVLAAVRERTGVDLQVLSGPEESRLTFLAVRRWFGWSAGRMLVVDIGGGSLEFAAGIDEEPDVALSLPLGAGRLTRDLPGDPPDRADLKVLRKQIRSDIARVARDVTKVGTPDRYVGTSKTIRSLARVTGAAPSGEGPYVERSLDREALRELVPRLATMTAAERATLPGVSVSRSRQLLAGAMVVLAAMDIFDVPRLDLCPWALREGVILRRLDWLDS